MSLDVYLYSENGTPALESLSDRIFIREDGQTREITRAEWDERNPGIEPTVLRAEPEDRHNVYSANITHNLGKMAAAVDLYEPLWRPEEIGLTHARALVEPLRIGLQRLLAEKEDLQQLNPSNGWGDYDLLVRFTAGYLAACEQWPDARVEAWR